MPKLISLLELLGATYVCDICGAKISGLTPDLVRADAEKRGWLVSEARDMCPACAPAETQRSDRSEPAK